MKMLPWLAWRAPYTLDRIFLHDQIDTISINGRCLDLGAGAIKSYREKINAIDCDLILDNRPAICCTIESLPFKTESINNILIFNVLEHVWNYYDVLREVYRILEPGGKLYGLVPFLINYHPDPEDYFRYTPSTINKLLTEIGFVVTVKTLSGIPLLIAQYINYLPVIWRFSRITYWLANKANNWLESREDGLSVFNKKAIICIWFSAKKLDLKQIEKKSD